MPSNSKSRPNSPASESATRNELYALAKAHGIEGRSKMGKRELQDALAAPRAPQVGSRFAQFQALAEAVARGELVMLPRHLTGNDRRQHVRQTLREDHQNRIAEQAEDMEVKFDKLAGSIFSFFRGTALLFYRDMAGEDAWMPTVLTLGDVHPKNFGVMPNANNVPIFGVNDFDEACYAPFTWDLKRGSVGFVLAAEEVGGYKRKRQLKIARRFIRGYVEGIRGFADSSAERDHERRLDNAPKVIRKLIKGALKDRADWLADDYLDEFKRGFRYSDKLLPISSRREEFQEMIDRWLTENAIVPPARAGNLRVKDVAIRKGAGTASLGLSRYYVLIEGLNQDGTDDLIIEFKKARRSAVAGLEPPTPYNAPGKGERIVHAQGVQLVRGDLFYGHTQFEGSSFMSRERAPFRDDIDLEELSKGEWKRYAEICGRSLAHAHALSDEIGQVGHDIEPQILKSIAPEELFIDDILRFAGEAADRLRRDHTTFQREHALGAFRRTDVVYV
ncbi:MAG: DUF2252 family protein [Opitutales bacterium]